MVTVCLFLFFYFTVSFIIKWVFFKKNVQKQSPRSSSASVTSSVLGLAPALPFWALIWKKCCLSCEPLQLSPALAFNDHYVHLLDNLLTDLCSSCSPPLHLSYISLINTPYIFILWSIPSDPLLWHRRLYTSSELSLRGWSNRAEAQSVSILHYSLYFCPEYHSFPVKHMPVRLSRQHAETSLSES